MVQTVSAAVCCVLLLALCIAFIAGVTAGRRNNDGNGSNTAIEEDGNECCEDYKTAQKQREREREAHYMRNFWDYDGSEQLDWDEEG